MFNIFIYLRSKKYVVGMIWFDEVARSAKKTLPDRYENILDVWSTGYKEKINNEREKIKKLLNTFFNILFIFICCLYIALII